MGISHKAVCDKGEKRCTGGGGEESEKCVRGGEKRCAAAACCCGVVGVVVEVAVLALLAVKENSKDISQMRFCISIVVSVVGVGAHNNCGVLLLLLKCSKFVIVVAYPHMSL